MFASGKTVCADNLHAHFTRRAGDGGGGVHDGLLGLGQRRGHATEEQSPERCLSPLHVVRCLFETPDGAYHYSLLSKRRLLFCSAL